MSILSIENLTKVYGSKEIEVKALNNINFKINKGEFVVIVGKSGSGKSTLLHLMAGLETPTEGKIVIDGVDIASLSEKERSLMRRKKIGLIFSSTFNIGIKLYA